MTLAVIGSQACGKSAFIRRAWKNSLVTEAARHSVPITDSDGNRILHCMFLPYLFVPFHCIALCHAKFLLIALLFF